MCNKVIVPKFIVIEVKVSKVIVPKVKFSKVIIPKDKVLEVIVPKVKVPKLIVLCHSSLGHSSYLMKPMNDLRNYNLKIFEIVLVSLFLRTNFLRS
jgi:hypothetical protein